MSLSKQQIAGVAGAGIFLVLAGGLGYMLWDAAAQRTEAEDNLAAARETFERYNNASVFPSAKSIADVSSNKMSYATWQEQAVAFAAKGDRPVQNLTPAQFKERLQAEVRRMAKLPGGVEGAICAPTFLFGFDQYLGEGGVLPAEADVPRLMAQLDLIAHVVDLLADAGVHDVQSIERVAPPKPAADGADADRPKRKAKKADVEEAEGPKTTCLDYKFAFSTRPAAFVAALNALAADSRFIVINDFSFKETADLISDRLAAAEALEASKNAPASASRRRRRGAAKADDEKTAKTPDRLVVDPESDAPILVNLSLAVYDFGRAPEASAVVVPVPAGTNTVASAEAPKTPVETKPAVKPTEKKEGK